MCTSLADVLQRCENALMCELQYCAEDADDMTPALQPREQSLATLKSCTEELSALAPVPRVTDGIAGYCADLLESCATDDGVLFRIITQFLADMSLQEDNVTLFLRFGMTSYFLLVLQRWPSLTPDTLNSVFDFLSTISTSSAQARQAARPCIPYILAAMQHDLYAMDVLFGGVVALSTLTTMSPENSELVAQRGGVQVLIGAFYHACRTEAVVGKVERRKLLQSSSALLMRAQMRRLEEKVALCSNVQKWSRDALLKVCRANSEAAKAALREADFGAYGHCIPLDELKWALILETAEPKQKAPLV